LLKSLLPYQETSAAASNDDQSMTPGKKTVLGQPS